MSEREEVALKEAIKTIIIIGLEGKVNLEDLHKGIYLIMGKPECVQVQIAPKDEPNDVLCRTGFQQVHFWEDQPTAAFWDSFVDVAAGEVIIANAWGTPTAQAKKDPVEELVGITTIEEFEPIEEIKGSCPKCGGPLEFREHIDTFNEDGSPITEDTCRDPYCPSCKLLWLGQEASA